MGVQLKDPSPVTEEGSSEGCVSRVMAPAPAGFESSPSLLCQSWAPALAQSQITERPELEGKCCSTPTVQAREKLRIRTLCPGHTALELPAFHHTHFPEKGNLYK